MRNKMLTICLSGLFCLFSCSDEGYGVSNNSLVFNKSYQEQTLVIDPDNTSQPVIFTNMKIKTDNWNGDGTLTVRLERNEEETNDKIEEMKYDWFSGCGILPATCYSFEQEIKLSGEDKGNEVEVPITVYLDQLMGLNTTSPLTSMKWVIPLKMQVYRDNDELIESLSKPCFLKLTILVEMEMPEIKEEYVLDWADEFDYNGKPNPNYWVFEKGFVRNAELQWYQEGNATCKDGCLKIEARRERVKNPNYIPGSENWRENREYAEYTSACCKTGSKNTWNFGRFEIRAKIPTQMGAFPAIWTVGDDGWPHSGEIDLLEFALYGNVPSIFTNLVTAGGNSSYGDKWYSRIEPLTYFTKQDPNWANKFHIWRMDWEPEFIKVYIDDVLYYEKDLNETYYPDGVNAFHYDHELILNLAVGQKGGDPSKTEFPLLYEVDYVRVYRKAAVPLKGNNVALGKSVEVESSYSSSYTGDKLTDGKLTAESRWLSNKVPTWAVIDLEKEYEIAGINILSTTHSGSYVNNMKNFSVQYWNGSDWQTLLKEEKNFDINYVKSFLPVKTNKIRLWVDTVREGSGSIVRVGEIQVLQRGTITE